MSRFYDLYGWREGNEPTILSWTQVLRATDNARTTRGRLVEPWISTRNAYSRGQPRIGLEIIRDKLTSSFLKASRNVHKLPGVLGSLTASVVLLRFLMGLLPPQMAMNTVKFGTSAAIGNFLTVSP